MKRNRRELVVSLITIRKLFLLVGCTLSLSLDAQAQGSVHWQNQAQLDRVWRAATVTFPKGVSLDEQTIEALTSNNVQPKGSWPTVIFVHGCAGMLRGEKRRVEFFSQQGYLVISPDSFARKDYPRSCRIFPKKAFMHRGTLNLRNQDIAYAVEHAKALDYVDPNNIYLVGHSEGAIVTTTIKLVSSVNARVAESWTCQSEWPEYRGINAPDDEPTLTLVSRNDPWFREGPSKGSCDEFINEANGSLSRVYEDAITDGKHKVLDFPSVQQEVLEFMNQFRR